MQLGLLFDAVIGLILVAVSGAVQSRLRVLVGKHEQEIEPSARAVVTDG